MCGTLLRFPTHGSPGPEPGEPVPIHPGRKELTSGRRHQVQVKGQGQGQGEMGHWGQELVCVNMFRHTDQQAFTDSLALGAGNRPSDVPVEAPLDSGGQCGEGVGGDRQSLVGTRAWKGVLKDEMAVARARGRRAAERRGSSQAGRELRWFRDDVGVAAGARPTRHLLDFRLQRSGYKTL